MRLDQRALKASANALRDRYLRPCRATAARGFTLVELLVVISITAILAAIAVPNFSATIERNRNAADASDLASAFNRARAEAARTGAAVSVCALAAGGAQCAGAGNRWESGWIVFADPNTNRTLDAGEEVFERRAPLDTGSQVQASATNGSGVTFRATGQALGGMTAGSFTVTSTSGASPRLVCLLASGRVRIAPQGATGC